MSPESRRETIIDAAMELVEREGAAVPTRKIAECAGIAEGTLFRVFPTKADLVKAVAMKAADPGRMVRQLETIDRTLPLEDLIAAILDTISSSLNSIQALMLILRRIHEDRSQDERPRENMKHFHLPPNPEVFAENLARVRDSISFILEPGQDRLSVNLADASSFILMVATAPMKHFLQPLLPQTALLALVTRALIKTERVDS